MSRPTQPAGLYVHEAVRFLEGKADATREEREAARVIRALESFYRAKGQDFWALLTGNPRADAARLQLARAEWALSQTINWDTLLGVLSILCEIGLILAHALGYKLPVVPVIRKDGDR